MRGAGGLAGERVSSQPASYTTGPARSGCHVLLRGCQQGAICLRGSPRKRGHLPGKMHASPAVFPPASLFLSTHLFSFSSRLYFKDDVLPSTSLPSLPASFSPSPLTPRRWISCVPWNRARNNKYLWVPGEGWTVNHYLSLCLLWKELALQNLH